MPYEEFWSIYVVELILDKFGKFSNVVYILGLIKPIFWFALLFIHYFQNHRDGTNNLVTWQGDAKK